MKILLWAVCDCNLATRSKIWNQFEQNLRSAWAKSEISLSNLEKGEERNALKKHLVCLCRSVILGLRSRFTNGEEAKKAIKEGGCECAWSVYEWWVCEYYVCAGGIEMGKEVPDGQRTVPVLGLNTNVCVLVSLEMSSMCLNQGAWTRDLLFLPA